MRLGKVIIRGFFSYSDRSKSVINLHKRGLFLVSGKNYDDPTTLNNGAAKSAIVEALLWCLFGQTLRGQKGDEVVNRKGTRGACVSVTFYDDNGQRFRVTRYRKHPAKKNAVVFMGPGVTANESSRTQEAIEAALGFTYSTFVASVVFGQGAFKRFAEMTDAEKKGVTDKLIGLEVLSKAHKEANDALKNIDNELDNHVEEDLAEYEEAVEEAKNEKREWVESHAAKLKRMEANLSELEKKAGDVRSLRAVADDTEAKLKEAKSLVADATKEVSVLHDKTAIRAAEVKALRSALNDIASGAGKCAHCGSVVSDADLKAHRDEVKSALRVAEEKHERAEGAESAQQVRVTNAEKPLRLLEQALISARNRLAEAKALSAQVDALRTSIESERAEENPHKAAVERAQSKLEKAKERNERTKDTRKELEKKRARTAFIVGMFSDKGANGAPPLKGLLVDTVAPYLNKRLAYYSRKLTDGNIEVSFSTQATLKGGEKRDNYALEVTNRFGADVYQGLSGGEKRKVDVIVFFALQDLAATRSKSRCALLCLDEVFDALDETAQEVLVEHLQQEAKKKETILVITQRPELEGYFSNVVTVVKKGGISRIK